MEHFICVKEKVVSKPNKKNKKEFPDCKIINPKTGRCVKIKIISKPTKKFNYFRYRECC